MDFTLDITLKNRKILYHFLDTLPLEALNKIPKGFNNNIFWNIKHTVVVQQMLVYGLSKRPLNISSEEIAGYKKDTKPVKDVTQNEVAICKKQLFSLIEKTQEDYKNGLFQEYTAYTVTTKSVLKSAADAMVFNNFHEGIHLGYVMALMRAIQG